MGDKRLYACQRPNDSCQFISYKKIPLQKSLYYFLWNFSFRNHYRSDCVELQSSCGCADDSSSGCRNDDAASKCFGNSLRKTG